MHEAINCYLSVVLNWWLPGAPVLCWEVAWYGVGLLRHHWLACLQPWIRYGVTPEILSVGVDALWLEVLYRCTWIEVGFPSIAHVKIKETENCELFHFFVYFLQPKLQQLSNCRLCSYCIQSHTLLWGVIWTSYYCWQFLHCIYWERNLKKLFDTAFHFLYTFGTKCSMCSALQVNTASKKAVEKLV